MKGARREQPVVVILRVAVVVSWLLPMVFDPRFAASHRAAAWTLLGVSSVYGTTLLLLRVREAWSPPSWTISVTDSLLTLVGCGLTGGARSQLVAVLPLIVIAAGLGGRRGYPVAALLGIGYTLAITLSDSTATWSDQLPRGLWWTAYLLGIAVLVEVFSRLLERQYEVATRSRAEAIAEHEALLEERDLRERLSESQHARQDGLRVILHEFRTPVASMTALSRDLASGALPDSAASTALSLISAHAEHLRDMLDNLADLALADGSPVGRLREQTVMLAELAEAVLDAAAIPAHRRICRISPYGAAVRLDGQLLRRVLTNLAENAARHSVSGPVELYLSREPDRLIAEVSDRGPGLPPEQLGLVSRKYVSLGERRGTAGLGLWIVAQLVSSQQGALTLNARDGGGLVAHLEIPLVSDRETAVRDGR